jgi:hypothetical protein
MIAHNNEQASLTRLRRDLLPALSQLDAELIVIDNSDEPSGPLADATVCVPNMIGRYYWQRGDNLLYGPSLNLAVTMTSRPYLLYVCTNHGHARDATWASDLLAPLADPAVGMTGCLQDAGPPENAGFSPDLPHVHIQGGVFAARTEVLRSHPYPDGEYAHWGADIYECFTLMQAGYKLIDVPTVRSVWRTGAGDGNWKYVHEDSPRPAPGSRATCYRQSPGSSP